MLNLLQDISFALRSARKNPGFTCAAAATLALAIGANTAIFSIVSGVLMRPLPFPDPDRIVQVENIDARAGAGAVYYLDLLEFRKQTGIFQEMATYGNTSKTLVDGGSAERIQAVFAERSLFRVLGVAPAAGRTFDQTDPDQVAVLS